MADKTGFATGGVSSVLTVGSSIGNTACSTATPPPPFKFDFTGSLQQCQPFGFTWDDTAVKPVTITGVIPSGEFVQFKSGPTDDAFTWNPATVPAGATLLFFLQDSQGNFGGTSQLLPVGNSDTNTCLNSQSPESTSGNGTPAQTNSINASGTKPANSATQTNNNPSSTIGQGSTSIGSASSNANKPKSSLSGGAIGGIAAGGAVALAALGLIVYFFCIRNRTKKDNTYDGYSYDYLKPTPFTPSVQPSPPATFQGGTNVPALGQQYQPPFIQSNSQSYTPTQTMTTHHNHNALQYPFVGPSEQNPSLQHNGSSQQSRNYPIPARQPNSNLPVQSTLQQQAASYPSSSVPVPGVEPTRPAVPSTPGMASYVPPSLLLAQRQAGENQPLPTQHVSHPSRSASPYTSSDSGSQLPTSRTYLQPPGPLTQTPMQSPAQQRLKPPSPRVIQHTDAEDQVIELPPQYNPHRGPGTELGSSTAEGSTSVRSEKS